MARKLSCWQGKPASGGIASAGGKRFLTAALACLLGLCLAWPVQAAPGDRFTKDKGKGTAAPAASKPAAASQPAADAAGDDPAPSFSKAAGAMALGSTTLRSPADFNECVRVALAQSPLLTKSSIEIESKRLDVGDAYSQYIPTIVMSTTFYLRLPEYENTASSSAYTSMFQNPSSNPSTNLSNAITAANSIYAGDSANRNRKKYDLSFSTGSWNPLLTAFDVQAKKELVNIAVLSHLKVIDGGLKRLGATYLQIGMVETMIAMAKEKEELAHKNLEYVKTRAGLGQGANLDVRIAETKINLARAEAEKMRDRKSVV